MMHETRYIGKGYNYALASIDALGSLHRIKYIIVIPALHLQGSGG